MQDKAASPELSRCASRGLYETYPVSKSQVIVKSIHSYFYFCATYRVAGENPVPPTFETRFTRMEYAGSNCFHLSFMRHTGQWVQVYDDLTLDECLAYVKDDEFFQP